MSWYKDVSKLKLVVVSKKQSVSKPKMRPLGKIRLGGAGTLTTLTTCNNEILGNLAPVGQDLPPILSDLVSSIHNDGRFGHWIL